MSTASKNPPHPLIAREIRRGTVVPFLGAGVNFGGRPEAASWQMQAAFLPSGKELSGYFADLLEIQTPDPRDLEDLAKVTSYFVNVTGERETLRDDLRKIFTQQYRPCSIHNYLAEEALSYVDNLPAYHESSVEKADVKRPVRGTPLLVVTTNYDDLIETAFKNLNRPYDLVVYPTDRDDLANAVLWWKDRGHEPGAEPIEITPNQLRIDLQKTNVIYKMHGSIDRIKAMLDSFVITEEDYVNFLSRLITNSAVPMQFMSEFRRRRFLFLGYGLNDWNLRVVLSNLHNVLTTEVSHDPGQGDERRENNGGPPPVSRKSWAIQYQPSDLETELWRARRVDIFDQDINAFANRLRDAAKALSSQEVGHERV